MLRFSPTNTVMAGLDPAIHVLFPGASVDAPDKPGHDDVVGGKAW
jgi:hypothetical protein